MSHHTDWTSHRLCYYGADTGLQLKLRDHCHKCMHTRQCRQAYWLVWQHCPVTTYRATLPLWPLPPPSSILMHVCMWHFSPPFHFSPTSSPFLPSLITISSPHFNPAPYTPPFFLPPYSSIFPRCLPLASSFLSFFSSLPCLHPILFCLKRILVRMNWLETQRWKMLAFVLTFLRI